MGKKDNGIRENAKAFMYNNYFETTWILFPAFPSNPRAVGEFNLKKL